MVNSISATERVALWDRFSAPVDQHAIKIDFIRRARNPNPPFRFLPIYSSNILFKLVQFVLITGAIPKSQCTVWGNLQMITKRKLSKLTISSNRIICGLFVKS